MAYITGLIITGISSLAILALGISTEIRPDRTTLWGHKFLDIMFIPTRYFYKLFNRDIGARIRRPMNSGEIIAARIFGAYAILGGLYLLFLFVSLLLAS